MLSPAHAADIAGRRHRWRRVNGSGATFVSPAQPAKPKDQAMSIAKIIEVNAASKTSMEDAVKNGLKKTSETVKGIKGAWVNEIKVVTDDNGNVTEWRVNLRITFVVQ
jgi:flavin-binding protein dodecin